MLRRLCTAAMAMVLLFGSEASAREPTDPPRRIIIDVIAPASIDDVWSMWTTEEGLERFFAKEAIIEPEVGGEFSIHFFPEKPPGERGAEGMFILAFEPEERLSFTWNAPQIFPYVRGQFAVVTVLFDAVNEDQTRVSLIHDHFGEGDEWDKTFTYFSTAWAEYIMPRFLHATETGAVDWDGRKLAPVDVILNE